MCPLARVQVIARSIRLGFLTGQESRVMLDAHCQVELGMLSRRIADPAPDRGTL